MSSKLKNPKNNIIAIIIAEVITLSVSFTVNYKGLGMIAIILKWIPAIIGITTLLFYFISRLFIKKYNWIISIIGIIFMFFTAYYLYTTDFTQTQ